MIMSIFICEDNIKQRSHIEMIVSDYAAVKDCDVELALSTGDPTVLLKHLEANPHQNTLYFLDVDLQHEINGIILASEIRKHDAFGKIVFVTTHAELSHLTFRYRLEAMDYIIKDNQKDIAKRIKECMEIAHKQYLSRTLQKEHYQVKTSDGVRNIALDEIMFFESHHISHKLILHARNKRIEFYGSLSDVTGIGSDFFRCHKSFVVNIKNVKYINKTKREVEMVNGEIALVTAKKIKSLLEVISK